MIFTTKLKKREGTLKQYLYVKQKLTRFKEQKSKALKCFEPGLERIELAMENMSTPKLIRIYDSLISKSYSYNSFDWPATFSPPSQTDRHNPPRPARLVPRLTRVRTSRSPCTHRLGILFTREAETKPKRDRSNIFLKRSKTSRRGVR